jgi:hypothetical protein
MVKVHYSEIRRALMLDISGNLGASETSRAVTRVADALRKMEKGYTLIEVFSGKAKMTGKAVDCAAALIRTCYERGRIWRVIRLSVGGGWDPGLNILHITRWKRRIPEMEVESIGAAMRAAEEETQENEAWWAAEVD